MADDGVEDGVESSTGDLQKEDDIRYEEVATAVGKLKNSKAPGICGITTKKLNGGGGMIIKWLHSIIQLM